MNHDPAALQRVRAGLYITADQRARVQRKHGGRRRGWVVQVPNPRAPGWHDTNVWWPTLHEAAVALSGAWRGRP